MNARGLVIKLEASGIAVSIRDGGVVLNPGSLVTPVDRAMVGLQKSGVLEILSSRVATSSSEAGKAPVVPVLPVSRRNILDIPDNPETPEKVQGSSAPNSHTTSATGDRAVITLAWSKTGEFAAMLPDRHLVSWSKGRVVPVGLTEALASDALVLLSQRRDLPRGLVPPSATILDVEKLARPVGLPSSPAGLATTLLNAQGLVDSARTDAVILRHAWDELLWAVEPLEPEVRWADEVINDRGFQVDLQLARAIRESCAALHDADQARVTFIAGKAERLTLDATREGRVRHSLRYCGAHTGRWTGCDIQPQNLPRGVDGITDEVLADVISGVCRSGPAAVRDFAKKLAVDPITLLGSLLRASIVAPPGKLLLAADYASIEPRVLAWLAGEQGLLARFKAGEDVYCTTAADLYGISISQVSPAQRRLGKAMTIGCGFGQGPSSFQDYAKGFGVDWSAVGGITPQRAVAHWREAHPNIVALWKEMEAGVQRALDDPGDLVVVKEVEWRSYGDLACFLPSQRPLFYRRPEAAGDRLTYEHRGQRISTYGAKLTQNVVQAIARDILAQALVDLEKAGVPVVLHVHDEVIMEVTSSDQKFAVEQVMCRPPDWAPGLPLAIKSRVAGRWQ